MAAAPAKEDPYGGSKETGQWTMELLGQDSGIIPKPCFVFSL